MPGLIDTPTPQMATHHVSPRQPTILADRDYFELSDNNLFISANVS